MSLPRGSASLRDFHMCGCSGRFPMGAESWGGGVCAERKVEVRGNQVPHCGAEGGS